MSAPWQQCAIRPATEHLSADQQQALHRIGPRSRGLTHLTARLLIAAARGELDDHWFKTASNAQGVALQSLLQQGVLVTVPCQTQITLAPHAVYGLEPERTKVPARGDISPIPHPPPEHPIPPAAGGDQLTSRG